MKSPNIPKNGYRESERHKNEIAVQVSGWMQNGMKVDEMGLKNWRKYELCKKMRAQPARKKEEKIEQNESGRRKRTNAGDRPLPPIDFLWLIVKSSWTLE